MAPDDCSFNCSNHVCDSVLRRERERKGKNIGTHDYEIGNFLLFAVRIDGNGAVVDVTSEGKSIRETLMIEIFMLIFVMPFQQTS